MLTNAAPSPPTAQSVPDLGHLKAAAERIGQANYNLATFHNRFFGPMPESAPDSTAKDESLGCYKNDINAVFEEVSRLENLVNALTAIG